MIATGTGAVAVALVVLAAWLRGRAARERASCVAHEVRGPLTAALLVLHGARRRGEVAAGPAAQLDLELRRAAQALGDPQGDAPAATTAAVDLRAIVRCQAATWREVAAARGGRVTLADADRAALPVRADPLRVAQATANVIANALEHGGGEVEIRSGLVGGRARVEVTDAGPGLPAARPRRRRRDPARGRGLAITARVLARDGGHLRILPSAHGGRVAIELPAAEAVG